MKGWRLAYYGSGVFALIIGLLSATTLKEPARTTIGEEHEENTNSEEKKKKETPWKVMLQPRFIMLCIAASIRHTGTNEINISFDVCIKIYKLSMFKKQKSYLVSGGLCFAYNCDQFYRDTFPHVDLGAWLFFVTFVIGGVGVLAGGYASDKIVANMGIKSRVAVLAISQV